MTPRGLGATPSGTAARRWCVLGGPWATAAVATVVFALGPPGAVANCPPARAEVMGVVVPAENDPRQRTPRPRPPPGDLSTRAARLLEAVASDRPERALELLFPRGPFLLLKGIADPGRYHAVLIRHFVDDVHALHASVAGVERARFAGFDFSHRATWQAVRSEANALPYWCVRHSRLRYTIDGTEGSFEVRTMIHWGPRWYVTHLR